MKNRLKTELVKSFRAGDEAAEKAMDAGKTVGSQTWSVSLIVIQSFHHASITSILQPLELCRHAREP